MDIQGTYTLQAPPEAIWHGLGDRQKLLAAIPGVERLERIDDFCYALTLHIKQPLLRGSYTGRVTITDQHFPYHCRVLIESEEHLGQSNALQGSGIIHLNQHDQMTVIAYQGTVQIGKHGTRLPISVSKGATKLIVQQLFTGLADQLRAYTPTLASPLPQEIDILSAPVPESAQASRPPLFTAIAHYIVRLLRLGGANPEQEARWTARVRRIGIFSGLLFLVWLGTRLPPRSE